VDGLVAGIYITRNPDKLRHVDVASLAGGTGDTGSTPE